jgi:hypothetical protein
LFYRPASRSCVAFDKVRKVFQRADVILSPLRLPIPPRPLFDSLSLFALYLQALDSQSVALDTFDGNPVHAFLNAAEGAIDVDLAFDVAV